MQSLSCKFLSSMKISIITVVYNNIYTINDAILSVYNQSYENIEYIIIDGQSSDGTKEILKKQSDKYSILISEPDLGIYDAMNKGIRLASGDIIGILNSDDLYQNQSIISEIMQQFIQIPDLDILYGDLVYVKYDDTNKVIRNWESTSYYPKFFEYGNIPPHPSLFLKRRVYKEVGLFNLEFKLAADYEFMLRAFKIYNYKTKYINKVIVKMRLGGATNKSFSNILKQNLEILKAWKNNNLKPPLFLMPLKIIKRFIQFI